jgi:quercetin dioxygenase-like cupin family protein
MVVTQDVQRRAHLGMTIASNWDMDTTFKKVDAEYSPSGPEGQKYLVSGKHVSMRHWRAEPKAHPPPARARDYETVGYVLSGRAHLQLGTTTTELKAGDSWLVPAGAEHAYVILEPFVAIEATTPPAQLHDRDAAPGS